MRVVAFHVLLEANYKIYLEAQIWTSWNTRIRCREGAHSTTSKLKYSSKYGRGGVSIRRCIA